MTAITFDTLAFVKHLKSAGVPDGQAEAHAEAIRAVQDAHLDELSTKADLDQLEGRVKLEMSELRGELKLHRWMLGFLIAGITAILIRLFFMPLYPPVYPMQQPAPAAMEMRGR